MAPCNGCVEQLARERAHLSTAGQAGPMDWWCTRDTNQLCDFSWSSIAQESKCQVRWVEAWFIALSFQLFLSGESSHADRTYFGKRGLQEDDSGWRLLYLSFAGKEAHLYLFYTSNSQNLSEISLMGKDDTSNKDFISKHRESQKRGNGDSNRLQTQTTQYLLLGSLSWKPL